MGFFGEKGTLSKNLTKRLKMVKIGDKIALYLSYEKNRDRVKKNRDSRKFSINNRDCPS